MSTTPCQLPIIPYNGQIWIDSNKVRWQWSTDYDVWIRIGSVSAIPLADTNTIGLLSSANKRLLDSIPIVSGAFGIITSQQAVIQSPDNRVGLVSGQIELHSDSLDIRCVDSSGAPYLGQITQDILNTSNISGLAGLEFSLSDKFLSTMCLEVYGPAGPKGDKGPTGKAGKDGFNNGPQGEKGDPGTDVVVAGTFTGIKIIESDEIVDEAVVSLEMNGKTGQLSYTTAKMNVPSDIEPADQLSAIPIQRSITYPVVAENGKDYVTLDDWQLEMPTSDPLYGTGTSADLEVLLVKMPSTLEVGDTTPIELSKLTDFVSVVVQSYKDKLVTFQDTWMAQMKEYVEGKDAAAREVLSSIAQQVAQCEFKRPLEFCLIPGTKITIDSGLTNSIELVAVGDPVLCDDGCMHNVLKTMVREVDEELCVIYPSGTGRPLTLTQDHPVLIARFDDCRKKGHGRRVYRNDLSFADFDMIPASEIKPKDLLFIPCPSGDLNFEIGEELSEFLGWYAAEGDARNYTVRFSLGPDEFQEADRIVELGSILGATSCSIKEVASAIIVNVFGKRLHDLCLLYIGHGARHKKLSPQMMWLCSRDFNAFAKAFILGDGFAGKAGTGHRIESTLASIDLIEQLFWLFAKHGYASTRWFGLGPGGPKYRDRKRMRGHLNLSQSQAHKFLPDIIPAPLKPIPCSLFEIEDGFASRVRKIDRVHYKGPVYNIEVSDRNTYLASGVVVHNCLGITPSDCTQNVANNIIDVPVPAGVTPQAPPSAPNFSIQSTGVQGTQGVVVTTTSIAAFDPTDPTKCLLPYQMVQIIITDEANPVYVTGIPDAVLGSVNLYPNDKSGWEKIIDGLSLNQTVALGLLQIPRVGDGYYGDERDMLCEECTLPYDSMRGQTYYKLLPRQSPKITSTDIVNFVIEMLDIQLRGSNFIPNQINILFKSKALSDNTVDATEERTALEHAISDLLLIPEYQNICFVSAISSSSPVHNQDDRWLLDAATTVQRYLCYYCANTSVPGHDHVVILCVTDEASPIYSYVGYKGPDGISGPINVPKNMTPWDFDFAKWNDSISVLQNSSNKVRLGILQPLGYAGASPRGGALKPSNRSWPGDTDRNKITLVQTNTPSFTADDILTTFQLITNNGSFAPTILYLSIDTSGSLGEPSIVSDLVDAGIAAIKLKYPNLIVSLDIVDIGPNKQGEVAIPPLMPPYISQAAPDINLWGWEYVSVGRNPILFPSLYVRSAIDASERWLGRAAGIVEQLLYYWIPAPSTPSPSPSPSASISPTHE